MWERSARGDTGLTSSSSSASGMTAVIRWKSFRQIDRSWPPEASCLPGMEEGVQGEPSAFRCFEGTGK